MSGEFRTFFTYATFAVVAVLLVYGLVLLGQALFDSSPAEDRRYRQCLDQGGSFSYDGGSSDWTCEVGN